VNGTRQFGHFHIFESKMKSADLKEAFRQNSSAADELGASRPTLYELMEKLGIARWE
jgi:DNA-binding NtrC family response regulator